MLIQLTDPQNFDRFIAFLEAERNLRWPNLRTKESYRDWFIRETKELMSEITVYLNVDFTYNPSRGTIAATVHRVDLFEVQTDEEYLTDATRKPIKS